MFAQMRKQGKIGRRPYLVYCIFRYFKAILSENKIFYCKVEAVLGFLPKDINLYRLSLTHRSVSSASSDGTSGNNERLEYLGDAVLDSVVSEYLYKKYPKANEGFLTRTRSKIVNGKSLSDISKKLKITSLIISNTKGNRSRMYEDALEAFIGAIYLDRGYKASQRFIENKIIKQIINIEQVINTDNNFKSILIEWVQKNKYEMEFYTDYETPGDKYFISYLRINNQNVGKGRGLSKKSAEQKASENALKIINKGEIKF